MVEKDSFGVGEKMRMVMREHSQGPQVQHIMRMKLSKNKNAKTIFLAHNFQD